LGGNGPTVVEDDAAATQGHGGTGMRAHQHSAAKRKAAQAV